MPRMTGTWQPRRMCPFGLVEIYWCKKFHDNSQCSDLVPRVRLHLDHPIESDPVRELRFVQTHNLFVHPFL